MAIVISIAAIATLIAGRTGSWWWSTSLLAVIGLGSAITPVRRRVVAFAWCAIVRHRLRVCFAAFIRSRNRLDPGLAPVILTARPTPAGERVWVWLRTGLDIDELERSTAKLAVACWASEVQVCGSRRFAALVRLDVTRRDPLRLDGGVAAGRCATPASAVRHCGGRASRAGARASECARGALRAEGRAAVNVDFERIASIFDPVFVGIDEFGEPVHIPLIYRNILVGGEPGVGQVGDY